MLYLNWIAPVKFHSSCNYYSIYDSDHYHASGSTGKAEIRKSICGANHNLHDFLISLNRRFSK